MAGVSPPELVPKFDALPPSLDIYIYMRGDLNNNRKFALVLDVLDLASLGSALLDLAGLGSCFALQALSLEDPPPTKEEWLQGDRFLNGWREAP